MIHHIKKIKKFFISFFFILTFILIYTANSFAQKTIFENPIKHDSLGSLLIDLIDWVVIILIPILVLSIVYIGFRMVLVLGSRPEEYTKWKNSLGWSLVGLFIVLGAKGIILVIQNTVDNVLRTSSTNASDIIDIS